jgi:hypothetical protein
MRVELTTSKLGISGRGGDDKRWPCPSYTFVPVY